MANEKFRVYELVDADGLPRFVGMARVVGEEAPWRIVWRSKDRLPGNKLAAWLRTLDREPTEKTVLGRAVHLTERAAHALVKHRLAEIADMAGCAAGEWPDFIVNEPAANVGRRGRPTTVVEANGSVTTYPSVTVLARVAGVAQQTMSRGVGRMLPKRNGHVAF